MNQTVTFLKQVRSTIEKPERWCQGHYASDQYGGWADIISPNAVKWCLVGAMQLVDHERRSNVYCKAYETLDNIAHGITHYNDHHSHPEVIALLDKAIKRYSGWRRLLFWKQ